MKIGAFKENVAVAFRALSSQKLRALITIMIIAIGIMALVGILTSIDAVKSKINQEFSILGSNTFTIITRNLQGRGNRSGVAQKVYPAIDYREAQSFKERFEEEDNPGLVSLSANGLFTATIKHQQEKTNPNVRVIGSSDNYLKASGYELAKGRGFSRNEQQTGDAVVVLGSDIVKAIYQEGEKVIGSEIFIGAYRYTVVGLLRSKGNSFGFANDNQCIVPLENLRKNFATSETRYTINVYSDIPENLPLLEESSINIMRQVRRDKPGEGRSFEIQKSDQLVNTILETTSIVRLVATIIAVITLLGAGIGLMNIMLASVTERTREIGVRKAMGASEALIKQQFLIEAVLIGQMGGVVGTILGILIGFILSTIIQAPFNTPWIWIIIGIVVCFVVGVVSGYYPAKKAAELDPIDALRYE